jgi:cell division protein FtsQ
MMPHSRSNIRRDRTRRRLWPFGSRGNRRVRPAATPVVREPSGKQARPTRAREGEPSHFWRGLFFMVVTLAVLGAAGYGGHHLVTHARHFAVKTLKFPSLRHASEESLQARAALAMGVNLFSIDLSEVEHKVAEEPWVKEAHARRELPSTIVVDVVERDAACVVALNALYLADARGNVFKRANPDEAAALPVITGIERDSYLAEPDQSRAHVQEALTVALAWRTEASRPALGELHWDKVAGVTAYTREGAVGVRLGRIGEAAELEARLRRFDVVWAALTESGEKPRLIYLDNRARPDRVTVKLSNPPKQDSAKAKDKSET